MLPSAAISLSIVDTGTEVHQSVVDILHIGIVGNSERLLHDDASGVDVVIEEEGGDTSLRLAIDDSPVDRRCATILRQQGGMHIERAETGHGPHHLGQHAESHHHLKVGTEATQLLHELGVFHLDRLQHGQALLQGILLDRRRLQRVLMASYGFVGLSNHSHHIISAFYEALEGFHRKLGCSHKNDS